MGTHSHKLFWLQKRAACSFCSRDQHIVVGFDLHDPEILIHPSVLAPFEESGPF
jgi:hypothetical protein